PPGAPLFPYTTLFRSVPVGQVFFHDGVGQRVDQGDVGTGDQRDVDARPDVRALHQIDAARIADDDLGAFTQALLHARGEYRMRRSEEHTSELQSREKL